MAGWNTIQRIRRLEEQASNLGFMFTKYKHDEVFGENIALIPKDTDALPIYSRDAVLFVGSLESAEQWMRGVEWAREYDRMTIDRKMDEKRARKEQDERNRILLRTIKDSKIPEGVKT